MIKFLELLDKYRKIFIAFLTTISLWLNRDYIDAITLNFGDSASNGLTTTVTRNPTDGSIQVDVPKFLDAFNKTNASQDSYIVAYDTTGTKVTFYLDSKRGCIYAFDDKTLNKTKPMVIPATSRLALLRAFPESEAAKNETFEDLPIWPSELPKCLENLDLLKITFDEEKNKFYCDGRSIKMSGEDDFEDVYFGYLESRAYFLNELKYLSTRTPYAHEMKPFIPTETEDPAVVWQKKLKATNEAKQNALNEGQEALKTLGFPPLPHVPTIPIQLNAQNTANELDSQIKHDMELLAETAKRLDVTLNNQIEKDKELLAKNLNQNVVKSNLNMEPLKPKPVVSNLNMEPLKPKPVVSNLNTIKEPLKIVHEPIVERMAQFETMLKDSMMKKVFSYSEIKAKSQALDLDILLQEIDTLIELRDNKASILTLLKDQKMVSNVSDEVDYVVFYRFAINTKICNYVLVALEKKQTLSQATYNELSTNLIGTHASATFLATVLSEKAHVEGTNVLENTTPTENNVVASTERDVASTKNNESNESDVERTNVLENTTPTENNAVATSTESVASTENNESNESDVEEESLIPRQARILTHLHSLLSDNLKSALTLDQIDDSDVHSVLRDALTLYETISSAKPIFKSQYPLISDADIKTLFHSFEACCNSIINKCMLQIVVTESQLLPTDGRYQKVLETIQHGRCRSMTECDTLLRKHIKNVVTPQLKHMRSFDGETYLSSKNDLLVSHKIIDNESIPHCEIKDYDVELNLAREGYSKCLKGSYLQRQYEMKIHNLIILHLIDAKDINVADIPRVSRLIDVFAGHAKIGLPDLEKKIGLSFKSLKPQIQPSSTIPDERTYFQRFYEKATTWDLYQNFTSSTKSLLSSIVTGNINDTKVIVTETVKSAAKSLVDPSFYKNQINWAIEKKREIYPVDNVMKNKLSEKEVSGLFDIIRRNRSAAMKFENALNTQILGNETVSDFNHPYNVQQRLENTNQHDFVLTNKTCPDYNHPYNVQKRQIMEKCNQRETELTEINGILDKVLNKNEEIQVASLRVVEVAKELESKFFILNEQLKKIWSTRSWVEKLFFIGVVAVGVFVIIKVTPSFFKRPTKSVFSKITNFLTTPNSTPLPQIGDPFSDSHLVLKHEKLFKLFKSLK